MSRLASWFTFELTGVGAVPDLRELQAFKKASLQMMIDKIFTFRRIFHKDLHHIQVFDVRYEWQSESGSGTLLPFPRKICCSTASAFTSLLAAFTLANLSQEFLNGV